MNVFVIFFIVFFSTIGANTLFVYAQDADQEINELCHIPSEQFQQYLDFSDEMIMALNAVNIELESVPYYPLPLGVFSSKTLEIPRRMLNFLEKITPYNINKIKRVNNASIATVYSSTIGLFEMLGQDAILGITVLFKKKPFARDLEYIQTISEQYQHITFDLISNGYRDKQIGSEMANTFLSIFEKYSGDKKFFKKLTVSAATRYYTLVGMLMRQNFRMKNFSAVPLRSEKGFAEYLKKAEKYYIDGKNGISMIPNYETIEEMTIKYKTLKGASCNSSLKYFNRYMKSIKGIQEDYKDSKALVIDSTKKLRSVLLGIEPKQNQENSNMYNGVGDYLTDYQIDILREVYGIDAARITKSQGIGLADLFKKSRKIEVATNGAAYTRAHKEAENISDNVVSLVSNVAQGYRWSRDELKKLEKMQDELKYMLMGTRIESIRERMDITRINIINKHEQTKKFVQMNDIKPLTIKFIELSTIVHNTRELIGTKQSQDSINKKLEEICEKQCSNKGNSSCRGTL